MYSVLTLPRKCPPTNRMKIAHAGTDISPAIRFQMKNVIPHPPLPSSYSFLLSSCNYLLHSPCPNLLVYCMQACNGRLLAISAARAADPNLLSRVRFKIPPPLSRTSCKGTLSLRTELVRTVASASAARRDSDSGTRTSTQRRVVAQHLHHSVCTPFARSWVDELSSHMIATFRQTRKCRAMWWIMPRLLLPWCTIVMTPMLQLLFIFGHTLVATIAYFLTHGG